jgi:hypothetical protein
MLNKKNTDFLLPTDLSRDVTSYISTLVLAVALIWSPVDSEVPGKYSPTRLLTVGRSPVTMLILVEPKPPASRKAPVVDCHLHR